MGAGVEHQQGEPHVVLFPHQQPVRLDVALPCAVSLEARQLLRLVLARQGTTDIDSVSDLQKLKKHQSRDEARKELHAWYADVGKSLVRELIAARDTIKSREEYVLNYFTNRSTNASAESLNSKMKGFRSQVWGVSDLPFFMYRLMKIFGQYPLPRASTEAPNKQERWKDLWEMGGSLKHSLD